MRLPTLLLALLLALPLHAANPFRGRDTALTITNLLGTCSGTAIGKHTVLLATHCLTGKNPGDPEAVPNVTGPMTVNNKAVVVIAAAHDPYDHSLLVLDHTFETWANVSGAPEEGHRIHFWGNPDGMTMILREGLVVGELSGFATLIDAQGWMGDSGAGLFNREGEVVGVISAIKVSEDTTFTGTMQLIIAAPIVFTPAQLALIK